jgi:biopolymer transport protein ExbB
MITELMVRFSMTGAGQAVMWMLVGISILSVAVIIERFVFFARHTGRIQTLAQSLNRHFKKGEFAQAGDMLADEKGFAPRVLATALSVADRGSDAVAEMALSASKVEKLRFERGLAFLGTIGNNAPFIGLFGTVLEIIKALAELGEQSGSNVGAGAVMATLSAALAATAVGLLVALPAVAFYNYFQRRLKGLQTGADALVHVLIAHLKGDAPAADPAE